MEDVENSIDGLVGKDVSSELVGAIEENLDHILSNVHEKVLTLRVFPI